MAVSHPSPDQSESPSFKHRFKARVVQTTRLSSRVVKEPIFSIPCITGFCSLGCVGVLLVVGFIFAFFLHKPVGDAGRYTLPESFPSEIAISYFDQVRTVDVRDAEPDFFQKTIHLLGSWIPRADAIYNEAEYPVQPEEDLTTVTMDWVDLPQDRISILAHYGRLFQEQGYTLQTRHDTIRFIDEGYATRDGIRVYVFIYDPEDNQVIDFMRVVVQYPNN